MNTHDLRHQQVRADHNTRDIINQAISALPEVGLKRAAEFLAAMGIPSSVAVRTLIYPTRRRH
ncbi:MULTISPECIES: hypothetical protein [unclassified Massilia]|uniref:hypothetical protein n=1 Tax=unclassified Massilia TaxID=2609279 RepID=UPI0015941FCB|nr:MULTISPECIES: hypothetical protein [unclassified Massilia]NVE00620.1 hypothetical protein [Massilia sp. BJB1822]UTY60250.1 hypothetical protein HPQ68_25510 [Massilia sp. erpn]